MNIKDRIKKAKDIKTELVKISEWDNVEIEVKTMTANQRAEMFQVAMQSGDKFDSKLFQIMQLISSCYDPETKELIFNEDDMDWLMEKASGPIEKLTNAIAKVSGLDIQALGIAEKK